MYYFEEKGYSDNDYNLISEELNFYKSVNEKEPCRSYRNVIKELTKILNSMDEYYGDMDEIELLEQGYDAM